MFTLFSYELITEGNDVILVQAASAVASATMTPLNVEVPPNKLLNLVAKVRTAFSF